MTELNIFMRFLHIISVVTLLGGVIAWRFAVIPATQSLAADVQTKLGNAIAAAWRPVMLTAMAGILLSGIYNYVNKTAPAPAWQAVIGIKFLLVLHVFAAGFLATSPSNQRRTRQLTGVAISGMVIVVLSAVLRYLSQQ
jgi:uncharacterized membrane protein